MKIEVDSMHLANKSKHFWFILMVILICAALLRFMGYNFSLPYIDQSDEPWFATIVLNARGLYDQPVQKGYPPGILVLYEASQIIVEQVTHQPAVLIVGYAIGLVRFWAVLTSLLTIVVIALLAKCLGGSGAGLVAAAAWTLVPIIAYHSVVALAEPWLLLFSALSLYWMLVGLKAKWSGWLVLSTLAGLGAVIFKYNLYPILAVSIAATLWRMKVEWKTRRITWLAVLGSQVLWMMLTAAFLFGINGASNLSDNNEVRGFLQHSFTRVTNIPMDIGLLNESIAQLGVAPLMLVVVLIVGVLVSNRRKDPTWLIGGLLVAGFSVVHALLVQTYWPSLGSPAPRYLLPAAVGYVTLFSAMLLEAVSWLGKRVERPIVSGAVIVVGIISATAIWVLPMGQVTLENVQQQTLPDTRTALAAWSLTALTEDNASILVNRANERTFNREWGGYPGPYRVGLIADVTSRPLADWHRDYVDYAVVGQDQWHTMQENATGKAYLDQMLLLKQFPPPGEQWRGPAMAVFRLWKMDVEKQVLFGGQILLTGYDRSAEVIKPGTVLTLRFYWKAPTIPKDNYSVFIHLTATTDTTTLLAQADGSPVSTERLPLLWRDPSETLVSHPFELKIPSDLPAGQYQVWIGLYNFVTGERLLTESREDTLALFTLTVN